MSYYVFCRYWNGFSNTFPFDEFKAPADEQLVEAVHAEAAKRIRVNPTLSAKWQTEVSAALNERAATGAPKILPGGARVFPPSSLGVKQKPATQQELARTYNTPLTAQQSQRWKTSHERAAALRVLGWHPTGVMFWPLPLQRFYILSLDNEQDVQHLTAALNLNYFRHPSYPRFSYVSMSTLSVPQRMLTDRAIDLLRQRAEQVPTSSRTVTRATYVPVLPPVVPPLDLGAVVRCAHELLDKLRSQQVDDGGDVDDQPAVPQVPEPPSSESQRENPYPDSQPKVDAAIRRYLQQHAVKRNELLNGYKSSDLEKRRAVQKAARQFFGRNKVAEAIGCRSKALVSSSLTWVGVADEFGLREKGHSVPTTRVGLETALEDKAQASFRDERADDDLEEQARGLAPRQREKLLEEEADKLLDGGVGT